MTTGLRGSVHPDALQLLMHRIRTQPLSFQRTSLLDLVHAVVVVHVVVVRPDGVVRTEHLPCLTTY